MQPKKQPQVVIKQDKEAPIPVEVIAKAIIEISEATKKALNAGLTQEAIVTLLHASSAVGKPDIRHVLRGLVDLRKTWCTR